MEKEFCRVRSASDIAISVTLIILGIVLFLLPYGIGIKIGGFFLFLLGSLFLWLFKSVYKETGEKNIYHKRELYFRRELLNPILKGVVSDPHSIDTSAEGLGWTIKLNVYYSKSADKGYIQLFEYVPYNYEPCTEMLEYRINQIDNLIK